MCKHLGRLTLGHPLGFESAIALTLLCPFDALPALVAISAASLLILDDCSHSYLLLQSCVFVFVIAQDDEIAV